ncbi:RNA polymerase sigma factor [Sinorhizobium sp. BG8]|uniref:RNA polymerase sigma factor n=1 Tax=Sinorhizobium sp. BG8 TaxID=2613773 RepID=UPI00193DDBD5|nr:RNA polymerase sigma factor [Sinorhizobium sp. BG8]QRM54362.1 RNA polymerase sigma factor [Sinorhizobium sp. BG8]
MNRTARDIDDDDLISTYLAQWKSLRGTLRKRTGSADLADDVLQETWIRLATTKVDPSSIRDRQAFILRIAGNIAIDLIRRETRHTSRCVSDEAVLLAVQDKCPSPEVVAIDRDQLRQLVRALIELPRNARLALLMSRCDGMSHASIASRLKVSESMVAKYLAQSLRHCRDHFRAVS